MLTDLKEQVWKANLDLGRSGLVVMTFGNVSGIDRREGLVAIKPSGVSYESLRPEDIVLVDLAGKVVEGKLNPSSDTPSHLELYKAFGTSGASPMLTANMRRSSPRPAGRSLASARPTPIISTALSPLRAF